VAVTAENKVATVERLSKLVAPCFWANRMIGTPKEPVNAGEEVQEIMTDRLQ